MKKKVLVIDNYDSFTYNLVHLINEIGYEVEVWRNDKFNLEDVAQFDKILLSPGPGVPNEAGLLLDVIHKYAATKEYFWRMSWSTSHSRSIWRKTFKPGQADAWCGNTHHSA